MLATEIQLTYFDLFSVLMLLFPRLIQENISITNTKVRPLDESELGLILLGT